MLAEQAAPYLRIPYVGFGQGFVPPSVNGNRNPMCANALSKVTPSLATKGAAFRALSVGVVAVAVTILVILRKPNFRLYALVP